MDLGSYLNAVMADDAAIIKAHLGAGFPSDLELPAGDGTTTRLLHLTVSSGLDNSTAALLEAGADPNILDSSGEPPLAIAIIRGRKRAVELLLKAGARLDIRIGRGDSFLHVALIQKQKEIAELLLAWGADPDRPNDLGITPRQVDSFNALKAAGWKSSSTHSGGAFVDGLEGLSEEGLSAMFGLLPLMISQRVASGEIDATRAAALNSLLREFQDATRLPIEVRHVRMREIARKLQATMGTPQVFTKAR